MGWWCGAASEIGFGGAGSGEPRAALERRPHLQHQTTTTGFFSFTGLNFKALSQRFAEEILAPHDALVDAEILVNVVNAAPSGFLPIPNHWGSVYFRHSDLRIFSAQDQ